LKLAIFEIGDSIELKYLIRHLLKRISCFGSDVGVKHLGDNLCSKQLIFSPNASPSSGKCDRADGLNLFLPDVYLCN
jgi:hypothetical protein